MAISVSEIDTNVHLFQSHQNDVWLLRNMQGITSSSIWGAAPAPAPSFKIGAGSAPCSIEKKGAAPATAPQGQ